MNSIDDLHEFIEAYPFGVLMSSDLTATHLPFIVDIDEKGNARLYGHFARANRHWRQLSDAEVLVVFNGPHDYISPRWYVSQPNVPTWNYAALQVKGMLSLLDDTQTLDVMERTFTQFEPDLVVDSPVSTLVYRQTLLAGIVAFKIDIAHWQGKQKLGQQKSLADQQGVVRGLQASNTPDAQGLLAYMQTTQIGMGKPKVKL
ncbi:FMN-binding negative transcriptional regulator [uncultured Shewanella sp.]|uniref:FMN-binding negative transcriptional regulator n=1 Tax=uncultured Shewanella sp. TaxID=173975 RepID=UPI00263470CC|nr:FMN-binding negative transcriptional regulator [uncultured Shewanella sp.]